MSLFKKSDFYHSTKNQTKYMVKTKLPTKFKTKPHKCSQCKRTNAKQYHLTEKESRWLCPDCVIKNNRRDNIEKPNFVRASQLGK